MLFFFAPAGFCSLKTKSNLFFPLGAVCFLLCKHSNHTWDHNRTHHCKNLKKSKLEMNELPLIHNDTSVNYWKQMHLSVPLCIKSSAYKKTTQLHFHYYNKYKKICSLFADYTFIYMLNPKISWTSTFSSMDFFGFHTEHQWPKKCLWAQS